MGKKVAVSVLAVLRAVARPITGVTVVAFVLMSAPALEASAAPGSAQSSSTTTTTMASTGVDIPGASSVVTPHRQWLNLVYANRSQAETLDLYMPAAAAHSSKKPGLVVYVHGGAWLPGEGDKSDPFSLAIVNAILTLGYAAASVDYRLSNEAHFPAQIQDVKAAVRWLRAHAGRYGYDPKRIAALGDSAGGQLVALLGTSEGVPALEGASLGYPHVSSQVSGVTSSGTPMSTS